MIMYSVRKAQPLIVTIVYAHQAWLQLFASVRLCLARVREEKKKEEYVLCKFYFARRDLGDEVEERGRTRVGESLA